MDLLEFKDISTVSDSLYVCIIALVVFAFLIPSLFSLYSISKIKTLGTDQYYHALLIHLIRDNKHKFVLTIPNFIGKNIVAYPQLVHWILSFFSKVPLDKLSKITVIFFHLLSALSLSAFTLLIHPFILQANYPIGIERLLLTTGIIYALNPYHYDMINAKNVGVSARGFGLLLGQIYLYLIILFMVSNQTLFLYLLLPVFLLILLSSTFTIQFVALSIIPLCVLYGDFKMMVPFFGAILIFYFWMPIYFIQFFQGQFTHKKIYANFLAPRSILKNRYSIWRDFIYDFWTKLFFQKERESLIETLKYISTNSIVVLVSSMPALIYVIYLWYNNIKLLFADTFFWYSSLPIFCCFLVFLLTSFRKMRFLGEPERYLEFSLGIASIMVSIFYYDNSIAINGVLILSLLFIIARYFMYKKALSIDKAWQTRQDLVSMREYILNSDKLDSIPKVFSNNMQACNVLMSPQINLFRMYFTQERIENYHYTQLFKESFSYVEEQQIIPLIKDFNFDFVLFEKQSIKNLSKIVDNSQVKLSLVKETSELLLYKNHR